MNYKLELNRIIFCSDAVMAIAMTMLTLNLNPADNQHLMLEEAESETYFLDLSDSPPPLSHLAAQLSVEK